MKIKNVLCVSNFERNSFLTMICIYPEVALDIRLAHSCKSLGLSFCWWWFFCEKNKVPLV